MPHSIIVTTGSAGLGPYALNFTLGILSRDHVKCRVNSEVDGGGDPLYRTLSWITDGSVNIASGATPTVSDTVTFTRTIDETELIHDYSDGAVITEANLDQSNLQAIMLIHQFLDGRLSSTLQQDLDMGGFKIVNLGDATAADDAATLGQLEDIQTAAEAAQAAAELAETHAETAETNAETAETNAEAAAVAALAAQAAAELAETNAETAETNAETAATTATTQAGIATTQASAAATSASNALTSENNAETAETNAETAETNAEAAAVTAIAAADIAAAAAGFEYKFSTNTASSDPTAGYLKVNNATIGSATELYISETSNQAQALAAVLASFDNGSSTNKSTLRLFKQNDPTVFHIFNVTGTLTDNGAWDTFAVSYVGGSGSFSADDVLTAQFVMTGDKGDTGATGPAGSVDIGALTGITDVDATADYVVVLDATDATNKKVLVSDVLKSTTDLTAETVVDTADELLVIDISTGTADKATVNNLMKAVNTFTAETAVDTADVVPLYDASASTMDKATVNNLLKAVTTFTAETAVDTADELLLYDASAATADKCTVQNLFKAVNTFAAETAVDTADVTTIYDVSAATADKCTVNEFFKAFSTFTAETSVDSLDSVPLYDTSSATADRCTVAELFKSVNTLTADGTPDTASDYVLTYDASATAAKKVLISNLGTGVPTGGVVNQVVYTYATNGPTGTTALPIDDTVPQITEGNRVFNQNYTMASNTNTLVVEFEGWLCGSAATAAAALFVAGASGAVCAAAAVPGSVSTPVPIRLTYSFTPGTTSAQAYEIRIGNNGGTALRLNGTTSARLFGGVSVSTLKFTEIKA